MRLDPKRIAIGSTILISVLALPGTLPAEEIAQWQLVLVKKSGTRHVLGSVSTPRLHEEDGLQQIFEVAEAFSALTDAPIRGPIW